jgi:hypothetical protein
MMTASEPPVPCHRRLISDLNVIQLALALHALDDQHHFTLIDNDQQPQWPEKMVRVAQSQAGHMALWVGSRNVTTPVIRCEKA